MEKVIHVTYQLEEQALNEQDIQNFMAHHNVELPGEFINHYLKHNGGWPNANWNWGIEEGIMAFTCFLSIKYGEHTIDKAITEISKQNLGLGNRMPFAVNALGGYYFIATDREDFGLILYAEIIPSEDGKKKLLDWKEHSKSFSDFLGGFEADEAYGKVYVQDFDRYIDDFDAYVWENIHDMENSHL